MGGKAVAKPTCSAPQCRWLLIGMLLTAAGCRSPLDNSTSEPPLPQTIRAAIEREIDSYSGQTPTLTTAQPLSDIAEELSERLEELEALSPATESNPTPFELGPDLTGDEQQTVAVTREAALFTAIDHNLALQIASLQPAINAEDLLEALAAFDFVLFGNVAIEKIDEPTTIPILNGIPLGTPFQASETYRFETGVRKRFFPGGELTASTDLTRFRNNAPGLTLSPDPAYTAALRLGYTQPLLRGFGRAVNTASIRLARHAEQRAIEELKSELLDVVEQTEIAYWELVQAWLNLEIQQWLVDVGIEVRDILEGRRDFDARLAEYADAVARVEQRQADVIRARRAVRAASDALKLLMSDPELTVGSEALLRPVDDVVTSPIDYNIRDVILLALQNRPELEQALLGIEDTLVALDVAKNALLPLLNLNAELAYFGLDDQAGRAYENAFSDDFVDYILGLAFEYPFGNRAAEAQLRRTRLRRTQAVLGYRQVVQQVVLEVKSALRDVITNYELIEATRTFRIAQAENLRTLQAEKPLRGLTPEFLNLEFQRQETLAEARRQEFQALVNFDQALASLYRAMGIGLEMNQIDFEVEGDVYKPEVWGRE